MQRLAGLAVVAAVSGLLALAAPGRSDAAQIVQMDSVSLTTTDWSDALVFSQFDPSLGTLNSITVLLEGEVLGTIAFESLDNAPATITAELKAQITLTRPDATKLAVVVPTVQTVDMVAAFDGTIDFDLPSGKTYTDLAVSGSDSLTTPPPGDDLALFTGLGTISLPVTAVGQSNATGAGNLLASFMTQAAAQVTLTYDYTPATVPEPSTLALVGLGLPVGLLLRRRRKAVPA
jgi:hypothetical protein